MTTETLNNTTHKKAFKKLGFSYLDTAEIVINLKQLLADYHVHYQKLRNFHWNVEGPDFFELHEEFEKDYEQVKKRIDMIAERIRVFGQSPSMSLQEIVKNTTIKESKGHETSRDMVKDILIDFGRIHDTMLEAVESAIQLGDVATEQLITDMIRDLEKRHWMYTAWMK